MVATRGKKTESGEPSTKQSSASNAASTTSKSSKSSSSKSGSNRRDLLIQVIASLLWLSSTSWLALSGTINLAGSVNPDKLTGFGLKAEFAFRYMILGCLWIVINLVAVGSARKKNNAENPLSGREHLVDPVNNVLRNTIEQFVLTIVTQLSLISYLPGSLVVSIIPLINIHFLIGRIAFFMGYPNKRTFGFILSSLPTQLAVLYVTWRFLTSHLGLLNWMW